MKLPRLINIPKDSHFLLFGPRQTGKSTYVKGLIDPNRDLYLDLLQEEQLIRLSSPGTFRKEIELHKKKHHKFTCIVDEVQNLPSILNEIHSLIESSTILKQEILAEGLVRNIAPFSKFIELAAHEDGELVNYTRIAGETGITSKTVREHYSILEDTFLAFFLPPFGKSKREQIIQHPKFFLFDAGVTNALARIRFEALNPRIYGKRFEQFIVTQLKALLSYSSKQEELFFWRTREGAEIDVVCGTMKKPAFALEIKSNPDDIGRALKHIDIFLSDYPKTPVFVLSPMQRGRMHKTPSGAQVQQLPWMEFFEERLFSLI